MSISHLVVQRIQLTPNIKRNTYPDIEKLGLLIDKTRTFRKLTQIHGFIIRHGLHSNRNLNFKLQRSYSSLGYVEKSVLLFHHTEYPNVYFYSAMIHGLALNSLLEDALHFYVQMLTESVQPNAFTISGVLKACTSESVRELHCHAYKFGFEANAYVSASLVDVYARGGDVVSARRLFDRIIERNVVATTSLIAGYVENGNVDEARLLFDTMEDEEKDIVSWNVVIDGYAQHGRPNEALILFRKLLKSRLKPSEVTMVAALSACAQLGAFESGKWIHSYLGWTVTSENVQLATALIDMYCKCGSLVDAKKVFDGIRMKDVVSYNAMIEGYSLHGQGENALKLFKRMLQIGLQPTDITFIAILNACAHSGLVSEGRAIFSSMRDEYGIHPKVEHYGCMVNLLGKGGKLDEAWDIVTKMEIDPDSVMWVTLLDSCRLHKNIDFAEKMIAFSHKHGFADAGIYVLVSSIYAAAGRWNDVTKTRAMMERMGLQKETGCSSIEVNNEVHEFVAGERKHARSREIYETLARINEWVREIQTP